MSSPALPPVASELLRELVRANAGPALEDNVDFVRFPDGMEEPPAAQAPLRLAEILRESAGLQGLYELLDDPADRAWLIRVLAFRVLGHRHVRLALTETELRELVARARSACTARGTAPLGIYDWLADDYDLTPLGYHMRLRAYVGNVVQTFLREQYRCGGRPEIGVRPGDVVIDGGACFGDTALYFAERSGPRGKVVAYEFEPHNLELLEHNLALNPELAARIAVHRTALWERPGERVGFRPFGPATTVEPDADGAVPTDTIDALVERADVDRVDLAKLDVEGSELAALRGAESTLRRFRPRLAIAAYHRLDDLAVLPAYLAGLGCGYRFRLVHTTMHSEETMLFATPESPR